MKDLVKLAEEYCLHYHKGQRRKGGNQEPYATHPFAVRAILVEHGYDTPEIQAMALLHDTIEDTDLEKNKHEIQQIFGNEVYGWVYDLSNNTIGKRGKKFVPLYQSLGVTYLDEKGKLTPQAYKLRILFNETTLKRGKVADNIHNTKDLISLPKKSIERKINDAESFYIPLGKLVCPIMTMKLESNILTFKESDCYKDLFLWY